MTSAFRRLQEKRRDGEAGFTLIELLVVIIIIGILAAIAIPVFLSQRKKAFDASADSDLRNLVTAQEAFFTDWSTYAAAASYPQLVANYGLKLSPTVTVVMGSADSSSFMATARSTSGSKSCVWNAGGTTGTIVCAP